MTRGVQLVRLTTSVVIGFAACAFVWTYDGASYLRYPYDHPEVEGHREASGNFVMDNRTCLGEFVTSHRTHAYLVPLAGLLLGLVIIWRWPNLHVLTELVTAALWVLALVWAGFVLIVWQFQNIPVFHGMQLHY